MKVPAVIFMTLIAFATMAVAQDGIIAYSEMLDRYVPVKVIKVQQTPMSQENFYTLLTGVYPARPDDNVI